MQRGRGDQTPGMSRLQVESVTLSMPYDLEVDPAQALTAAYA
ncbi:hypothetical protein DKM44_07135 [Deinococcus irradiatisoli]|uniref:Uncharacterized protein n=1 Tax=Deinococcus irradiatisoli TaxID=2202254 RepID=A0A2Z3JI14_9DEIO|nr:hypothetical protein DKM44_07135 [Deinococcus irradiatisoli]